MAANAWARRNARASVTSASSERDGSVSAPSNRVAVGMLRTDATLTRRPVPDPVRADLVFLELLKRHAQLARKLRLGHAPRHAPDAHVAADGNVDRAWAFGCAFSHSVSSATSSSVWVGASPRR
jgi:hypothetical protein